MIMTSIFCSIIQKKYSTIEKEKVQKEIEKHRFDGLKRLREIEEEIQYQRKIDMEVRNRLNRNKESKQTQTLDNNVTGKIQ